MVGIYFSGTGNSKYCLEQFLSLVNPAARAVSIEDANAVEDISANGEIVLACPVYYSNLPKIMRDFISDNGTAFSGKRVFIIATMGMFSGDGSGCAARLLARYGAETVGGLHLKMPDNISDEKVLKKTAEQTRRIIAAAREKLQASADSYKRGVPTQEGLGFLYHVAGLFGQRLWFYSKTKAYSDKLKISRDRCVGCGVCVKLCPLANLTVEDGKARAHGRCTMCYRCVSGCPKQAITLLGKTLYGQYRLENYI